MIFVLPREAETGNRPGDPTLAIFASVSRTAYSPSSCGADSKSSSVKLVLQFHPLSVAKQGSEPQQEAQFCVAFRTQKIFRRGKVQNDFGSVAYQQTPDGLSAEAFQTFSAEPRMPFQCHKTSVREFHLTEAMISL
jgi:hypothetical protein